MVHGYLWARSTEFASLAESTLSELHWDVRFLDPGVALPSALSDAWLFIAEALSDDDAGQLVGLAEQIRESAPDIGILFLGEPNDVTVARLREASAAVLPAPKNSGDLAELVGKMLLRAAR